LIDLPPGSTRFGLTKVVAEHELGVVFRFGKLLGSPRGPGRIWLVPRVDQLVILDMRPTVIDIPSERMLTKDGLDVDVSARVHAQVVAPEDAASRVLSYQSATLAIARAALRKVLKARTRDQLRSEHASVERSAQAAIAAASAKWGVMVSSIDIEVLTPE